MQTASSQVASLPAGAVRWDLPKLNGPQRAFVLPILKRAAKRLICFEGAIRAGKSWGALILVWCLALIHPGIKILIARWKQEDVDGTLTEIWQSVAGLFPKALHPRWDAAMHAYVFANGSMVYKKSLKSGDTDAWNSKWRGMTLAAIVIDQAEECPAYVFKDIKGRLSQNKHAVTNAPYRYPLHLILLLNSIDEDHWLADEFPTDNSIPGRLYLTGSVWDNRENLGDEVIAGYEEDYPVGDPRRRTLLEGKRGIVIDGEPCYEGYFAPAIHVHPDLDLNPHCYLLEGWDFSHARPAVTWAQPIGHTGAFHVLGGVQGFDMFLEDFAPEALKIRAEWFPRLYARTNDGAIDMETMVGLVSSFCDPAGATNNSGSRVTAVTVLRGLGVHPRWNGNANLAPERFAAIQSMAGMMRRQAVDGGPLFRVNPRVIELRRNKRGGFVRTPARLIVNALELAYVWDDKAPPESNPNVRRPKKNHRGDKYSHLMNGLEYIVIGANLISRRTASDAAQEREQLARELKRQAELERQRGMGWPTREERDALREAQRDDDDDPWNDEIDGTVPLEPYGYSGRFGGGRAGY